jgi:ATP-dependent DNA ligase
VAEGLVFVAFDLILLDGKDLRAMPIEERRAQLRRLIPRSPKSRLQYSEAIAANGAKVFASAEAARARRHRAEAARLALPEWPC